MEERSQYPGDRQKLVGIEGPEMLWIMIFNKLSTKYTTQFCEDLRNYTSKETFSKF